MKTNEISNTDNIIDSRDVIARIDDLQDTLQRLEEAITEAETDEDRDDAQQALDKWKDSDEHTELETLLTLQSEAEGSGDWHHGETLIADHYFTEYAEQLAEDIGAIDRNARWPLGHINWESAAESLKMDYTAVDFGGNTYWLRA